MTNDKNLVKKQTTSARARKRKLRPVEKHLVTAFNQASVGLVIFQINGTVIHVNNACGHLTGYSPNELINNRFGLVIHPDDQTHYENHLYELTKGGSGSPVIQIRCIHKEGQQIWVKLHTTILEQESGQIQSLFSIVEEVTQEVILRDDQRKLLTLVDNSIELMSILEMDGKNSYINKAGLAMLGFDNAQQVQQTPISQLHAPEHFDLVEREVLPSVMSTGRWSGDMLVRHLKTGEIFPVFNNTIRIDDPYTGQPLAVGAVMRDRRPEVEAQRALEESELFARNVFHHSPVAKVVFVGQEMVVRTINEKMLALLGTDSTIIGKPFKKAMPALIATPLGQPLDQVFATGETYYQPEVRIPTGRSDQANLGYYDCIYKALHNTAGETYGIIVTASEVTGQVLARQKVEETETALHGAIELAQLGTWQMDLTTGLIEYSPRLRAWYGLTPDEPLSQQKSVAAIRQTDLPLVQEAITKAIVPGSSGLYDIEYTVEAAQTGQERILRAQGKAFFNAEGFAYRLSGTVQDITEQRNAQLALEQQVQQRTEELEAINEELAANNEELIAASEEVMQANQRLEEANYLLTRSNQNLEQFAYIASHDLQEPLRKVQQFGDLLINRYGTQLGEGRTHLERMQVAASRMSRLIKDLLAFSRISTRPAPPDSVALSQVINRVLDSLAVAIEEAKAEILVDALPTVPGDALQLEQLFQNLISNALKFSRTDKLDRGHPPRIIVRTHQVLASDLPALLKPTRLSAMYQCIEVIDNGIGFDEKYRDRIFQVFQRLHGKNEFAGTGIGLAICQKVVTNHGGAITATSKPGQGATFGVYLPV